MATKYFEIEGNIMWANNLFIAEANPNYPGSPEYYKCTLEVDLATRDKFKDSGVKTRINNTPDGKFLVLLKRPKEPKIDNDGKPFGGGRPEILDKDGNQWPDENKIGNGSRVKVKYITYTAGPYSGHRLESISILDYVPYDNERREREEEPAVPPAAKEKTPKVPF